ncbi:SRPBCC family protein [Nocardioides montaniterrae]
MGQVSARTTIIIHAPAADVMAALSDYTTVRPSLLPEQYTDYEILEGGVGTGTVVTWQLHATEKRVRHVVADVIVEGEYLTEKDRNSSMVTVFHVEPLDPMDTAVILTTTWDGATGIGGFFERTFAPKGLNHIHDALLNTLAARLDS